jgi:hypothetical protein
MLLLVVIALLATRSFERTVIVELPTVASLPTLTAQAFLRPTLPPIWTDTPSPTFVLGALPTFSPTRFPPPGHSYSQCLTTGAWEDLWGYLIARHIRGWEQTHYCCGQPLDDYATRYHCLPVGNVRITGYRITPTPSGQN